MHFTEGLKKLITLWCRTNSISQNKPFCHILILSDEYQISKSKLQYSQIMNFINIIIVKFNGNFQPKFFDTASSVIQK